MGLRAVKDVCNRIRARVRFADGLEMMTHVEELTDGSSVYRPFRFMLGRPDRVENVWVEITKDSITKSKFEPRHVPLYLEVSECTPGSRI